MKTTGRKCALVVSLLLSAGFFAVAEEQHSVLTALSQTTLTGSVDTSGLFGPAGRKWIQHAPPPAEPPIVRQGSSTRLSQAAITSYSIGDPTPEEQLYLEFINRARANPVAEGQIFYNTTDPVVRDAYDVPGPNGWVVDLNLMLLEFAALPALPPLAMNAQLTAAARGHTEDMFTYIYQAHTNSDLRTMVQRIDDTGYNFQVIGENVFSYADSVFHGHAGFEVDWGPGLGGMQTGRGHRASIHNPVYREVGIGVVLGTHEDPAGLRDTVGPQLVTQNFGVQQNAKPLLTGVAYYDLNANSFYDIGEGIGGVNVSASGTATTAVTARSGGWAIPVAGDGNYRVTFEGGNLPLTTRDIVVTALQNAKVDFVPAYVSPTVSGPATASTNGGSAYTFTPVGGAGVYEWRQFQQRAARLETAEDVNGVTTIKAGSYNIVDTRTQYSGAASFHLVHLEPVDQVITLKPVFLLSTNSSLTFQSRLGIAASGEVGVAQISADDGLTWATVYSQSGVGETGTETSFNFRSVDLRDFAGKTVRVRFLFQFESGSYYPSTDVRVGWHLDSIQLQNASEILSSSVAQTTQPSFTFAPSAAGEFGLQIRARCGHDFLPWGPVKLVTAGAGAPEIVISGLQKVNSTQLRLTFELRSGAAPAGYKLQSKADLSAVWADDATSISVLGQNRFEAAISIPAGSTRRFYRVVPNP